MPTVLVVDDEANIRELVSLYLTSAGFVVECAVDGTEAIEKARSLSPDVSSSLKCNTCVVDAALRLPTGSHSVNAG
jgi:CheY-like chemotaxis protein